MRPRIGDTICEHLRVERDVPAQCGASVFERPVIARARDVDEALWLTLVGPELLPAPLDVSRFMVGANSLVTLEHPGLCEVRLVDREGELCVVAVAPPDDVLGLGEFARDQLPRNGCTPALIVRLARELAAALAFLHSHGLVHGVLGPATVLVSEDRCCTWQWGLLELCSPAAVARALSPRDDVHAWAQLLAFAAGVRASSELDPREAWRAVAQGLPRELSELVQSALDPEPEGRPPDGGTLAAWLGMDAGPEPPGVFEPNEVVLDAGTPREAHRGTNVTLPAQLEPDEPSRMELLPEVMATPVVPMPPPPTRRPLQPGSSGIAPPRPRSSLPSKPRTQPPKPVAAATLDPRRGEAELDAVLGSLAPPSVPPLSDPPPASPRPQPPATTPPAAAAVPSPVKRPTSANTAPTSSFRPPRAPGPHGPSGRVLAIAVGCFAGACAVGVTAMVARDQQGLSTFLQGRAATSTPAPPASLGESTSASSSAEQALPADAVRDDVPTPVSSAPVLERCPEEMAAIHKGPQGLLCVDQGEFPGLRRMPDDDVSLAQARARCSERGRRLCTLGEWQLACRGTDRKFPYGNEWVRDRCNFAPEDGRRSPLSRSGARDQCSTPEGVYDLLGNVGEWVDEGLVVGGDALTSYAECTSQARVPRGASLKGVGFRCCLTVTPR